MLHKGRARARESNYVTVIASPVDRGVSLEYRLKITSLRNVRSFVLGKLEHSIGRYIIIAVSTRSLPALDNSRFPCRNPDRSARSQGTNTERCVILEPEDPTNVSHFLSCKAHRIIRLCHDLTL